MNRKLTWTSPNGKYRVHATLYDGIDINVTVFAVLDNDRTAVLKASAVPKYVLEKEKELRSRLESLRKSRTTF